MLQDKVEPTASSTAGRCKDLNEIREIPGECTCIRVRYETDPNWSELCGPCGRSPVTMEV